MYGNKSIVSVLVLRVIWWCFLLKSAECIGTYNLVIWYWPRVGVISLAGKVTTGMVECNGSLQLGLRLMSPTGWLPRNLDQLRAQRS